MKTRLQNRRFIDFESSHVYCIKARKSKTQSRKLSNIVYDRIEFFHPSLGASGSRHPCERREFENVLNYGKGFQLLVGQVTCVIGQTPEITHSLDCLLAVHPSLLLPPSLTLDLSFFLIEAGSRGDIILSYLQSMTHYSFFCSHVTRP